MAAELALSGDTLCEILSHLTPFDLCRHISLVSRAWRAAAISDFVWKQKCIEIDVPVDEGSVAEPSLYEHFRENYSQLRWEEGWRSRYLREIPVDPAGVPHNQYFDKSRSAVKMVDSYITPVRSCPLPTDRMRRTYAIRVTGYVPDTSARQSSFSSFNYADDVDVGVVTDDFSDDWLRTDPATVVAYINQKYLRDGDTVVLRVILSPPTSQQEKQNVEVFVWMAGQAALFAHCVKRLTRSQLPLHVAAASRGRGVKFEFVPVPSGEHTREFDAKQIKRAESSVFLDSTVMHDLNAQLE